MRDLARGKQFVGGTLFAFIGEAVGAAIEVVSLLFRNVRFGHGTHSFVVRQAISQRKRRRPTRCYSR
jgi:hypothetical protein